MQSNKKRIRIDYAPLNVATSVRCTTPLSPALQVYNSFRSHGFEFEPDREISPAQFWPEVIANAADGSWIYQSANMLLTNMHWYVNGVEISQHPDWTGNNSLGDPKYIIDTSNTNTRGAITIQQNVTSDTQYSLHFEATLADTRLGTLVPIKTDPIILSSVDMAEDGYGISIKDDQIIQYNPFKDKLLLYDYMVAHGEEIEDGQIADDFTDENSYIRTIAVTVYQGDSPTWGGHTLRLYRVDGVNTFTELTTSANKEVLAITDDHITLDLRLISKQDFVVVADFSNNARPNPRIQFSVNRIGQDYFLEPTNGASILANDVLRYDEVMCSSDGHKVEFPENIIKIEWYTDTATKSHMYHNEGQRTIFSIADTGIGRTYSDSWMEIVAEGEIKPAYDVAVDTNDDIFVDENNNVLIFN